MSTKAVAKKPLGARGKSGPVGGVPNFFQNKLDLSPSIKDDISAKGLEYRWINYKKFIEDGGMHEMGWNAYKAEKREGIDSLVFGNNPDGIIRRGDCLLAVRTKEVCEEHREWLKSKVSLQDRHKESKGRELKTKAREAQISVDDSFDDEVDG